VQQLLVAELAVDAAKELQKTLRGVDAIDSPMTLPARISSAANRVEYQRLW
jgi:hypothetical protein